LTVVMSILEPVKRRHTKEGEKKNETCGRRLRRASLENLECRQGARIERNEKNRKKGRDSPRQTFVMEGEEVRLGRRRKNVKKRPLTS